MNEDIRYMRLALCLAQTAARHGEVPVGAVVVKGGCVIGHGYNLREAKKDPTAHAEIIALRRAAKRLGGWRLAGCTVYVTMEPCPMCAGAMVNARIDRLVYGAPDEKAGYCGTLHNTPEDNRLNHRLAVTGGLLADACKDALRAFFQERRGK